MSESKKKIQMPQKRAQVTPNNVVLVPSIENLLSDAKSIIGNELARLQYKSSRSTTPLEAQDAYILQGYIKSLVSLSKEAREREAGEDPSDLTDREIMEHLLVEMETDEVQDLFRKTIRKKQEAEEALDLVKEKNNEQ